MAHFVKELESRCVLHLPGLQGFLQKPQLRNNIFSGLDFGQVAVMRNSSGHLQLLVVPLGFVGVTELRLIGRQEGNHLACQENVHGDCVEDPAEVELLLPVSRKAHFDAHS